MKHGMETAAAHLGGGAEHEEQKPLKEFHAKELHDGTYHVMKHHGDVMKPPTEGSAQHLEELHDHLEEHFCGGVGPHDGEKEGEKKQGHSEAASEKKEKPHAEEDEKKGKDTEEE